MKVALVGAGLIGQSIAHLLRETGDFDVVAFDRDEHALALIDAQGIPTRRVDSADTPALRQALIGFDALINALPYYLAINVASAAKAAGVHYFDLTEDVRATHAIRAIADDSELAFMPQCGLAPGFIGIVAHDLAKRLDDVREVKMRVGALPEFPTNALKYNLTWSIDGLINEYCQPCEAIREGRTQWVQPLEGVEHFSLDGIEYEAFNTSGGLGTLCETLAGKVETLDYKSVRYPGHRNLMKFLLDDLRMSADRDGLKTMLKRAVPSTAQDVVLIFVTVTGMRRGQLVQDVFTRKIFAKDVCGVPMSAIQITTAGAICAELDLFREGVLPQSGFVRQEQVPLDAFLNNRFGKLYEGANAVATARQLAAA
ncbi:MULTISPECIES: saccharopine dehydrogenase C-terminal domain-containing protein [Caballeronia]|jgi:saccharopine dehydrogenase-like NADP-dependent oxidoreductase|uniref:saccharopine dehydrogenase family protein n=1 Tax=Caballeronia TaxID=1827195 RepID=UPI00025BAB43|nr:MULTISPECIES: saccharopine dehydrogenase C-terminal domain-containing protein [Caballeronia]EKS67697.1 saccharopine dehydrogenase [Burkholderia sp. SJ98]MDR5765271.1 saccharopine dehydrogenase C-terminal domain-containing protein [Caballeronia sp. LZ028]MDR5787251.1 saccharopine dehydrogenase C-terminal domain-containing protein [Caballeronia sp. LP003]